MYIKKELRRKKNLLKSLIYIFNACMYKILKCVYMINVIYIVKNDIL